MTFNLMLTEYKKWELRPQLIVLKYEPRKKSLIQKKKDSEEQQIKDDIRLIEIETKDLFVEFKKEQSQIY